MNEFFKEKIVYALALLAALFAMKPIVEEFAALTVNLGFYNIELKLIYLIIMGILGFSVYLFSVNYITESPMVFVVKAGNFCYGASLLIPLVVLAVWGVNAAITVVLSNTKNFEIILNSVSLMTSIIAFVISVIANKRIIMRKLASIDRRNIQASNTKNEINTLETASKLIELEMYSNSILTAFSGLEYTLRGILNSKGITYDRKIYKLFDFAINEKVIPSMYKDDIDFIRNIRNHAAHPSDKYVIGKNDAEKVLNIVTAIFKEISIIDGRYSD